MKIAGWLIVMALAASSANSAEILIDFEDLLPPNSYEAGANLSGGFALGGATFNNYYDTTFGEYWEGFAYSTRTDATTAGFTNQYSAFPGSGANSPGYALAFTGGFTIAPVISLPEGYHPQSMMVTNTTYAALAVRDGDDGGFGFVRKFAAGDYFKLEIIGRDSGGEPVAAPIEFYLADYRDGKTFVASDWHTLDLSSLHGAASLHFGLTSTDFDPQFGMNTPAFFAIDNLQLQSVPEPSTWMLALAGGCALLTVRRRRSALPAK